MTTSGTVTLSGADTYSGGTTIDSGTFEIGTAASLGSSSVTLDGGTLSAGSSAPITGFGGDGEGGWTVNSSGISSTAITTDVLSLTDGNNNEARSPFDNTPVTTTGNFNASFTYTPSASDFSNAADGIAFVLQNATGSSEQNSTVEAQPGPWGITAAVWATRASPAPTWLWI